MKHVTVICLEPDSFIVAVGHLDWVRNLVDVDCRQANEYQSVDVDGQDSAQALRHAETDELGLVECHKVGVESELDDELSDPNLSHITASTNHRLNENHKLTSRRDESAVSREGEEHSVALVSPILLIVPDVVDVEQALKHATYLHTEGGAARRLVPRVLIIWELLFVLVVWQKVVVLMHLSAGHAADPNQRSELIDEDDHHREGDQFVGS